MAIPPTQSSLNIPENPLTCSIYFEPLTEAVTLVPCAHKIQQAAALEWFGPVQNGWELKTKKPCPLCRAPTLGYMVDHTMRNVVRSVYELPEADRNTFLENMTSNLAQKSLAVEKDTTPILPYPGKQARFVHTSGDWKPLDRASCGELSLRMDFQSTTEDSLLKKFSLLGYKDGDVAISIGFCEKDSKNLNSYLKQFDILIDSDYSFKTKTKEQLRILFNILAENNEIPASHFDKVKDIVTKGKHNERMPVPAPTYNPFPRDFWLFNS